MAIYQIKLTSKEEVASGTMAFHFQKPKDFTFKAGQFADFTLSNPSQTDAEGNTRGFSLASAPYEEDLMIATRMRDTAFKRELKIMKPGTQVAMDAPYGSFTLHNNAQIPAVFLTGGIGITPVRSILFQAAHDKLRHKVFVFDSNRRPEETAFLEELREIPKDNPNCIFVGTMTQMQKSTSEWHGELGHVTRTMLMNYIVDLALPIYYLSGPASMVAAMRTILNESGVNDDNIRTEEFTGY
jgi:ferredoxin-NADP reductase